MDNTKQAREDLWNHVARLSNEQLNAKITEDKWTIMQVLEHLYLMERAITAGLTTALSQEADHPTSLKPYQLTLDRSRRIDAPSYLMPSGIPQTFNEIHSKLDSSRQALLQVAEDAGEDLLVRKSYPHPVFGLMDGKQWLDFVGYHERRHLAQIVELESMAADSSKTDL